MFCLYSINSVIGLNQTSSNVPLRPILYDIIYVIEKYTTVYVQQIHYHGTSKKFSDSVLQKTRNINSLALDSGPKE